MCWSLEVSLGTAVVVYASVTWLWYRNASRDRPYAIFLAVFGCMQVVDAMAWWVHAKDGLHNHTRANEIVTLLGWTIIAYEPWAALLARCFFQRQWFTRKEFVIYALFSIILPSGRAALVDMHVLKPTCSQDDSLTLYANAGAYTSITPSGHLIHNAGHIDGDYKCYWRRHLFLGDFQEEIPLGLRIAFLAMMVYPFLSFRPRRAGLLQALILCVTWLYGLSSDSHANMWCFANVAQAIVMVLDPWLFKEQSATERDLKKHNQETDNVGNTGSLTIKWTSASIACVAFHVMFISKAIWLMLNYEIAGLLINVNVPPTHRASTFGVGTTAIGAGAMLGAMLCRHHGVHHAVNAKLNTK